MLLELGQEIGERIFSIAQFAQLLHKRLWKRKARQSADFLALLVDHQHTRIGHAVVAFGQKRPFSEHTVSFERDKMLLQKSAYFGLGENFALHPFAGVTPVCVHIEKHLFLLLLCDLQGLFKWPRKPRDARCIGPQERRRGQEQQHPPEPSNP